MHIYYTAQGAYAYKEGEELCMQTAQTDMNLYEEFTRYSYEELQGLFKNSKTKEEQEFYMTLANLFPRNKF